MFGRDDTSERTTRTSSRAAIVGRTLATSIYFQDLSSTCDLFINHDLSFASPPLSPSVPWCDS